VKASINIANASSGLGKLVYAGLSYISDLGQNGLEF
jgi:hypothetical protein